MWAGLSLPFVLLFNVDDRGVWRFKCLSLFGGRDAMDEILLACARSLDLHVMSWDELDGMG